MGILPTSVVASSSFSFNTNFFSHLVQLSFEDKFSHSIQFSSEHEIINVKLHNLQYLLSFKVKVYFNVNWLILEI